MVIYLGGGAFYLDFRARAVRKGNKGNKKMLRIKGLTLITLITLKDKYIYREGLVRACTRTRVHHPIHS